MDRYPELYFHYLIAMSKFEFVFNAIKENNFYFVKKILEQENDGYWKLDDGPFAGYTIFHLACLRGDYGCVKSLLFQYNADPNKIAKDGSRPVTLAVLLENYEIVKLLVNTLSNVNGELSNCLQTKYKISFESRIDDEWRKEFGSRMTLLTYAILKNDIELVDHLIQHNADVRIKSHSNKTLLMCAVDKLQDKTVELLIKRMNKDDINIRDNDGFTALRYLTKDKFKFRQIARESVPAGRIPAIMSILVRAEADIDVTIDGNPETLFVDMNHHSVFDFDCSKVMSKFEFLFDAIKENNVKLVKMILKQENDGYWKLDDGPFAGYTILHLACLRGDYDCVKSLLFQYKVNPNEKAKDDAWPITLAVLLEKNEIVKLLLDAGATVYEELSNSLQIKYKVCFGSQIDDDWCRDFGSRMTLLTYAILKNNIELVDLLIQHNADVRTKSHSNKTLLMCAVDKLQDKIVELLIERMWKYELHVRDDDGFTALHYLVKDESKCRQIVRESVPAGRIPDIMFILIKAGADIIVPIVGNPGTFFVNMIHYPVLYIYYDYSKVMGKFGFLFDAIKQNNVDLVKIFIEQANDGYWQLDEPFAGYTILHLACLRGDYDCAKSLLFQYNADPNKIAKDGARPITLAVLLEKNEIVKLLLNAGAIVGEELSNCLQIKYKSIDSRINDEWWKDFGSQMALWTYAILKNNIELVDLLIQPDANVTIKGHSNKTLLMYAVDVLQVKVVEFLIKRMSKDDLNIRDNNGFTALHYLVKDESKCRQIVKESVPAGQIQNIMLLLIRAGADVNVTIDGHPEKLFVNMVAYRDMAYLLKHLLPYCTYSKNFKPLFYANKPVNNTKKYSGSKHWIIQDLRLRQILGLPVLKEEVLAMENLIKTNRNFEARIIDQNINWTIDLWKRTCITFGDQSMSIYDILTISNSKFSQLARDQSFCTVINIASQEKTIHLPRIVARLEQTKKHIELLNKFSQISFYVSKVFHHLPFYCIWNIIVYLPLDDLENFANALFLREELENNETVLIK